MKRTDGLLDGLAHLWSPTHFPGGELSEYATTQMLDETRHGLMAMAFLFLLLLVLNLLVHDELGYGRSYLYTVAPLAALSLHVYFAARNVRELQALHLLGMALLVVSGSGFVLLAHKNGSFDAALFSSVVLLFMIVPLVPWGLREASVVTLLLYGLISSSTWSVSARFDVQTLWTLQLSMLGAAAVSLTLVARGTRVRKADLQARFELEGTHRILEDLSLRDPLTQCWNRRFLEREFVPWGERVRQAGRPVHLAVVDVDRFKALNDGCGHAFGDAVLQWLAAAFQGELYSRGHLVRSGGDEFVALIDADEPEAVLRAACESLEAYARMGAPAGAPPVSLSIGLASRDPEQPLELESTLAEADGAVYRAKRRSREAPGRSHIARVAVERSDATGTDSS